MYQVCGPCQPQGDPPCIYRTSDIGHAYGIMIETRRLTGKKDVHVFEEDNTQKIRVCRQCRKKIPLSFSGCLIHMKDFDYLPTLVKITQFPGVVPMLEFFQYIYEDGRIEVKDPSQTPSVQTTDLQQNPTLYLQTPTPSDQTSTLSDQTPTPSSVSPQTPVISARSVHFSDTEIVDDTDDIVLYRPLLPDNRRYRMFVGTEIVLEGLIGIGKSTLGRSLAKYLNSIGYNAKTFYEFVNNEFLSLYINDMEKYAFSFQVIMARERLRVYEEARKHTESGGISIIDRSLIGDVAFAVMQRDKGYINETEWKVYRNLIESENKFEPFATVFLNGTPQHAYERMRKRSLQSEIDGYTLEYFEELDKSYRQVMSEMNMSVINIPWGDERKMSDSQLMDDDCKHVLDRIREQYI